MLTRINFKVTVLANSIKMHRFINIFVIGKGRQN